MLVAPISQCFRSRTISGPAFGWLLPIDYRNHFGGPLGYFMTSQGVWYTVIGWAAGIMTNILGDGLFVYRCFVIGTPVAHSHFSSPCIPGFFQYADFNPRRSFGRCGPLRRLWVSVLPALAIVIAVENALPHAPWLNVKPTQLAVPWVSPVVGLNTICLRLLRMRSVAREALFPEMSGVFTSTTAILIESPEPFSITGIGLLVTVSQNGPLTFAFVYIWSTFCSLCPHKIILREVTVKEIKHNARILTTC